MTSQTLPKTAQVLQAGDILIVIHDFDARSPDELTLRKSERVELIELDDGFGDGWYLGKHLTHGGTGLFPGVYTTKAPSTTRSPGHHRQSSLNQTVSTASAHAATTMDKELRATSTPTSPVTKELPSLPLPMKPDVDTSKEVSQADVAPPASRESPRVSLPAAHHTTYVQRSIGEALGGPDRPEDSPVMNETLNVIDEHITDLSTPRQSLAPPREGDSDSEYSNLERQSFVAGPETDEEDNAVYNEAVVRKWDHLQTAQHLRELGVDSKHCDIFRDQEISGDVLLDMDQSFIYMKEYNFGVMGRRLKTWHKIRDFQRSVKGPSRSKKPDNIRTSLTNTSKQDSASAMPQPLQPQSNFARASASGAAHTPRTSWRNSMIAESPTKVSAAVIRDATHSRRHSSIDFGRVPDLDFTSMSTASPTKAIDKTWSVTDSASATTPTSSGQQSTAKKQDQLVTPSSTTMTNSPLDIDRGYFSGNEVENRKIRNKFVKRSGTDSASQPTGSNLLDQKKGPNVKRHSRLSSVDSVHEPLPMSSRAATAYHSMTARSRFRSGSTRITSTPPTVGGASPTVTYLEGEQTSGTTPSQEKMTMQERARKLMSFRAASDAVTNNEKSSATKTTTLADLNKGELHSPGSATPSQTSKSMDLDDSSSKGTDPPTATPKTANRNRPKTKLQTSAYTHGLMKISPQDARKIADHSGWMKKKSSGIMTTWKPRLFILRGRRLSYYYSENDMEERGIIDISGHKVLVANNDPITTLHATVTGASSKPSPTSGSGDTSPTLTKTPNSGTIAPFFFKLVPPKTGLSRAVQFTKPTIHYFQVDSIDEGRKWMGEIMKATIEHDLTSFETTNKQKTISLAKARARRERPPALDDTKNMAKAAVEMPSEESSEKTEGQGGLNIRGLTLDENPSGVSLTEALGMGPIRHSTEKTEPPLPLPPTPTTTTTTTTTAPQEEVKVSEKSSTAAVTNGDAGSESDKENVSAPVGKKSTDAASTGPVVEAS